MKRKKKNPIIENLEYFSLLLFIELVRVMNRKLVYFLAEFIGKLFFILDKRHRTRAIEHIIHAGVAEDKVSAIRIARASFVHLVKVGVDVIKLDQFINAENLRSHFKVRFESKETEEATWNSESYVFVGAHYGNWEISGLAVSVGVRPILSIMRPFDNKKIGEYFTSRRKMFRQEICLQKNALKHSMAAIRKGRAVGIIADQHAGEHGTLTTFFGHPASTHKTPAVLHLKTGATLIFGAARRLDDNFNYEFAVYGPFKLENPSGDREKDILTLTQKYTSAIEKEIRRDPTQWLWSHRRWLDINR
ncbi:MAG TPA: hypothetical protein DD381_01265 [Lentisphaeria bacterium]|nr:MAG: hypothetical protein A2X47_10765 [Lentisphaerae bacterium GWF2_38_69]HBM14973.1 hypothetical protein [Lentisphaeria bacterium]